MAKRILSGVQPSGKLHLGNYFGAIQQHIALQNEGFECFYFIADYHALTTVQDAELLRSYIKGVAIDYLALGLDPEKSVFFRQSDVPEVQELAWMFACVTGMGLLERAHSYKDKIARGIKPCVGLFYYPLLMAADILIYKPQLVPVGQDQIQHVEMTQDMATYFNQTYKCSVFPRPESKMGVAPKVPGTDGEKMSKSYGNTIDLQSDEKKLKKVIMSIKTDSTPVEAPKNPDGDNIFALYSLFANDEEKAALAARYRAGGMGYGDAKKLLLEKVATYFAPYRAKRAELLAKPDYVEDVLREGARKARLVARATLNEAKLACGLA
ncbi:MAG TPA: tryptophan--tRNA ligase [Planctomycetota bacterium]|nr:tryptophan--tRNA ligase [Planctomycetota bacterium]